MQDPESSREQKEEFLQGPRRLLIARVGYAVIFGGLCVTVYQYVVYDLALIAAGFALSTLVFAAVIPMSRRFERLDLVFHYGSLVIVIMLVAASYLRGGFNFVFLQIFILIPLWGTVLRFRRESFLWAAIIALVYVALFVIDEAGLAPTDIPSRHAAELLVGLSLLAFLTIGGNYGVRRLEKREIALARIQRELAQDRRLESLGRLAGGIAHDFNNLLAVLQSSADELSDEQDAPREAILDAIRRGTSLTSSLLGIARDDERRVESFDAARVVRQTGSLISRLVPERLAFEVHTVDSVYIEADPHALGQALVNLCLNARDAMPDAGRLVLSCSAEDIGDVAPEHVIYGDVSPGQHVVFEVSDEGVGIADDDIERVFEPFFTTKTKQRGTGLGLHRVQSFVRQSGGAIALSSTCDRGTTIRLFIRQVESPAGARLPSAERVTASHRVRGLRVLFVEDDHGVRRAVARMLRASGIDVTDVESGPRALELPDLGSYEVLLSDVVMPGMTGPELAAELLARDASLRVVLMTGYSESAIEGVVDAQVLRKPVAKEELLDALAPEQEWEAEPIKRQSVRP